MFTSMCDIFIMCFVLFLLVTYFGWNFNAIAAAAATAAGEEKGGGGKGRRRAAAAEVSLGVIMTNTEIKFHILLFSLH